MTEHEAIKKIREIQAHNNGLFDLDCHFATNIAVRCIKESQKYREIKDRLKTIYGECDGLLETFIDQAIENAVTILENHDGVDIGHPYQSRLLTDEDVDKWEAYKAIGTPEECMAAVEKQKEKKPIRNDKCTCPSCGTHNEVFKKRRNTVAHDIVYCWHCGQDVEIDRLEE